MVKWWCSLLLCVVSEAGASEWFIRPQVHTNHATTWTNSWGRIESGMPLPLSGVYGSQDGTSYANAWNGPRATDCTAIQPGDTVWLAGGTFLPSSSNVTAAASLQGRWLLSLTGTVDNPIVIRGDYGGVRATLWGVQHGNWGGFIDASPDESGRYGFTNTQRFLYQQIGGAGGTMSLFGIKASKDEVAEAGDLYWGDAVWGTNWFIPFTDATADWRTNLFHDFYGYGVQLASNTCHVVFSNINFAGTCRFYRDDFTTATHGSFVPPRNISFRGCNFSDGSFAYAAPGCDDWQFIGCTWTNTGSVPLSSYNGVSTSVAVGAHRVVMRDCIVDGTGSFAFYNGDDQVGLQGGVGHILEDSQVYNASGSAVELYTAQDWMTNCLIRNLTIRGGVKQTWTSTLGHGIVLSLGTITNGLFSGCQIVGNTVSQKGAGCSDTNSYGAGIAIGTPDWIVVSNNTVSECLNGIKFAPNTFPASGIAVNNIVSGCTNFTMMFSGATITNLSCDYNLFWPRGTVKHGSAYPTGSDAHSLTNNPLFVSESDYRIRYNSPARKAGLNGGYIGALGPLYLSEIYGTVNAGSVLMR